MLNFEYWYVITNLGIKIVNTHPGLFCFWNPNAENQILKKVKAKSERAYFSKILHFSRILDNGRKFWKYANFEGLQITRNPWYMGI